MKYKIKVIMINLIIGYSNFINATSFAKTFGGGNMEYPHSIQQTSDGGYVVAGRTSSFGAGSSDVLVIKLSYSGNLEWARTFGGGNDDGAYSIQQTSDGGYIVAGYTKSFGSGLNDFLVEKVFSDGTFQWAKTFGGGNHDIACYIQQTLDGGYIVAGYTSSFGGDRDFLIVKLSFEGALEWTKIFGGEGREGAFSIQQTSDGGYVVAGRTSSFGAGNTDFLVIKLSTEGVIEWVKTFGGWHDEIPFFIQQTIDGGYVVSGVTGSFSGAYYNFLVIKLSSEGIIEWSKTFGGVGNDAAFSIQQTSDGGYIIAGYTGSFGAGGDDFLIIKTQDGQMSSDCPWYDWFPTTTSPNISSSSPSMTLTSPILISASFIPIVSSPQIQTSDVCTPILLKEIVSSIKETDIQLKFFSFIKDKISLRFPGYSKDKLKMILCDVSGNEIISKFFEFDNYIEIKDKRIAKIKKGIYFLKIYLNEKEIGKFKLIKKD